MYRNFVCVIMIGVLLLQSSMPVFAEEAEGPGELYAKAAVLMDADSGRILYEKNGTAAMANASTTKILTCILALENGNLDSVVEVSPLAASQPKVHLGMRVGQKFYLKDLLYGLMLESFNDCAVAIAEHIGGNVEGFAGLMNDKAAEIGCKDSYFITPNGLDAKDATGFHHTTASDLAQIMRYCIKNSPKREEFLAITQRAQYGFSDCDGRSSYHCNNHNAFLTMMDGALSGKTGFTGTAGYCYVGALERDGKSYIVALLACGWPNNKTYKWSDTKKLMNYGLQQFEWHSLNEVLVTEEMFSPIPVADGQGTRIGDAVYMDVVVEKPGEETGMLIEKGTQFAVDYEIAPTLQAPVEKGSYIGKVTYRVGNEIILECPIRTKNAVEKIGYFWCIIQTLELFELF